jgi:hypothetical protein
MKVGLNPDMASWLNERIAKQREKKLAQEMDMAKVLLVAKCLARERKELVKENQQWSELHKEAIASAHKNTARIKDLLEENLKLTNSTVTLEITCRNLLAENEKALRELVDSKMKYLASCQLVASLKKENEQLRAQLEP